MNTVEDTVSNPLLSAKLINSCKPVLPLITIAKLKKKQNKKQSQFDGSREENMK